MDLPEPEGRIASPLQDGAVFVMADKDSRIRNLARAFLEPSGHRIHFAEDGLEALAAVRRLKPRVLITEILLPKLDGLALCKKVKADSALAQTRVLVFSILAASARAREAGADGFLAKPLAKERLVVALGALFDERP